MKVYPGPAAPVPWDVWRTRAAEPRSPCVPEAALSCWSVWRGLPACLPRLPACRLQMPKELEDVKIAILTCPFEPPKPKTKHKVGWAAQLQAGWLACLGTRRAGVGSWLRGGAPAGRAGPLGSLPACLLLRCTLRRRPFLPAHLAPGGHLECGAV